MTRRMDDRPRYSPSFFNSPRIRLTPHPIFSLARRMTSSMSFLSIRGRPTFSPACRPLVVDPVLIGFDAHQ